MVCFMFLSTFHDNPVLIKFNSLRYDLCTCISSSGLSKHQNEYIEEHIKRHGRPLDYYERKYASLQKNIFMFLK